MLFRPRLPLMVAACLVTGALLFHVLPGHKVSAQSATLTFKPTADAYVIQTSPTANYGANTALRVDNSPVTRSFLRFSVTGLNGAPVQSAKLRIYANSANSTGYSVSALANNTWAENSLTYNSAPTPGNLLATAPAITAGQWTEVNISGYIKADGVYNLALTTTSVTNTSLASREAGANAPQLVIVAGTAAAPTATKLPAPTATNKPALSPTATTTRPAAPPAPTPTTPPSGSANTLLMAGDICKHNQGLADYTGNCKKTGDLVRSILAANPSAQVQTLGDNVNNDPSGSYDSEYQDLYAPNWGSFLSATHILMGNHDTYTPGGTAPYYSYFGAQTGGQPGYYSYNIGANWHVIVLNAQCTKGGGCTATSPQTTWLKNDLAANTRKCVIAAWHQPRWTSGRHPDDATYAPWWNLLYQYKVDIVANGHNHNYERFDTIDPNENAAPDGIREFIVGTGGAPTDNYTYATHPLDPNEAVRSQSSVYGVLQLTLRDSSYDWKFQPVPGYSFTDSGSQACH